jgi:tetratricopeptide (TPR) repeat protein
VFGYTHLYNWQFLVVEGFFAMNIVSSITLNVLKDPSCIKNYTNLLSSNSPQSIHLAYNLKCLDFPHLPDLNQIDIDHALKLPLPYNILAIRLMWMLELPLEPVFDVYSKEMIHFTPSEGKDLWNTFELNTTLGLTLYLLAKRTNPTGDSLDILKQFSLANNFASGLILVAKISKSVEYLAQIKCRETVWNELGLVLFELNKPLSSILSFRKAIGCDSLEAVYNLSMVYMSLGYFEAQELCLLYLKQHNLSKVDLYLCNCFVRLRKYEKAICFEDNSDCLRDVIFACFSLGQYKKAISLAKNATDAVIMYYKALSMTYSNQFAQALLLTKESINTLKFQKNSDNSESFYIHIRFLNLQARLYVEMDQIAVAEGVLKSILFTNDQQTLSNYKTITDNPLLKSTS